MTTMYDVQQIPKHRRDKFYQYLRETYKLSPPDASEIAKKALAIFKLEVVDY